MISRARYEQPKSGLQAPPIQGSDELVVIVRCWHLADIPSCTAHVRFWGQSRHCLLRCERLLLAQSGHGPNAA